MLLARYGCTVMARRRKGPWMSSCDKTIMFTFNWIEVQQQQQHQHLTVDQRWVERKKRVSIFSECFTHHFMDTPERCDRWMEEILSARIEGKRDDKSCSLVTQFTCVCTGQRSANLCSKKHKQQSLNIYLFMVIRMMLICVWCELRD